MITFLHTADLQLGMKATHVGEAGARVREARFGALARLIDLACGENVDFIVIAGDLFEHNQVSAHTVSRTIQLLRDADPIPVYVLPGNHDWFDASSVYRRPDFNGDQAGNITVLGETEPVETADGSVLYPCPVTERWSYADPTTWIPARADEGVIRIGVAHGTFGDVPTEEPVLPIATEVVQRAGLDYLALGHTHGTRIYDGNRAAYPGTPEQTSFGEQEAGSILIVSVDRDSPPRIEARRVGGLTWLAWEREVGSPVPEALQALREEIAGLEDGPRTLLRLRVSGTVRADELPEFQRFDTWLGARRENQQLLHCELATSMRTTEELAGALRGLADEDAVIAGAVADLKSISAPDAAAPEEVAGEEPRSREELGETWQQTDPGDLSQAEVAQQALALLAEIAREVG